MEIDAKIDFATWANSYSGCDGGNISGSIWFCGIEFGGGHIEEDLTYEPVDTPPFVDEEYRGNFKTYQYNWKILKLYSTILGYKPSEYKSIYEKMNPFYKTSDTFKMNLYPIAFHNDSNNLWEKWHFRKTGFPSKPLYQAWCQLNRFNAIKSWVGQNNPKVIICTGSTYLREFLMAFSGPEDVFATLEEHKFESGGILNWKKINSERTILFITPFLGQGGLKSDSQIEEYGLKMQGICKEYFGNSWCKKLNA